MAQVATFRSTKWLRGNQLNLHNSRLNRISLTIMVEWVPSQSLNRQLVGKYPKCPLMKSILELSKMKFRWTRIMKTCSQMTTSARLQDFNWSMPAPGLNFSQRISNLSTSIWIVWWTLCLIKRLPERPCSNRIRNQQRKILLQTMPLIQQVISNQNRRTWRGFRTIIGSIIYSIRRLQSSLRFLKRKKTTWHSTRLVTYSPQLVRMANWSRTVIDP